MIHDSLAKWGRKILLLLLHIVDTGNVVTSATTYTGLSVMRLAPGIVEEKTTINNA